MPTGIYMRSKKTKESISNAVKKLWQNPVYKKQMIKLAKDSRRIPPSRKGKKMPEEAKKRISNFWKGKKKHPFSDAHKERLYLASKKYWDKVGRSDVKRYHHIKDRFYLKWRSAVFNRDGFTCQICFQVGNFLNAHHIRGWAIYPKLRYILDNGITLCQKCHKLIHCKEWNGKQLVFI